MCVRAIMCVYEALQTSAMARFAEKFTHLYSKIYKIIT